jgi:hypothetical protein
VGGSVPVFDEIVISMQLMNKVLKLDDVAGKVFFFNVSKIMRIHFITIKVASKL